MLIFALIVALLFVSSLAFYAGTLLFKLQAQNKTRQANINKRVTNITESIQTIAKGVEQQQCNLSEASIRIYHLLEGLPVLNKPDFAKQYPAMFELYEAVKDLPTHQERNKQSKMETRKQDIKRESLESTLESRILAEMEKLAHFSI